MQVGPLMLNFVLALSLTPLCQTQHPPITLTGRVIALLAISHFLLGEQIRVAKAS